MKQLARVALMTVLLAFGVAAPYASGEMMEKEKGMMGEQTMALMADSAGKGAKGEAVIKDSGSGRKEIALRMTGLKPNSVYTVWRVNMKPKLDMMGIGSGDYTFKSDSKGDGHYSATVSANELHKWQMLEIAYHPDGDPKNMKKMGIALKAELMMEKSGMMEKDKMMDENKGQKNEMMEQEKGMMKK